MSSSRASRGIRLAGFALAAACIAGCASLPNADNIPTEGVVMGRAFGQEMETLFEQDLSRSTQVVLEQWQQRPWLDRMKESGAAAVKYWI